MSVIHFFAAGGKAYTWRCKIKSADENMSRIGLNFHMKTSTIKIPSQRAETKGDIYVKALSKSCIKEWQNSSQIYRFYFFLFVIERNGTNI